MKEYHFKITDGVHITTMLLKTSDGVAEALAYTIIWAKVRKFELLSFDEL